MLIGREHNSTLEAISKWEMKRVIRISIVYSALFNIGHIFQFYLNNGRQYLDNDTLSKDTYYYAYDTYPTPNRFFDSSISVSIYLFVYFLISFLTFFIVNTGVEVTLIRKLHSELADKKKRLDDMEKANKPQVEETSPPKPSIAPVVSFRKRRKQQMEETTEQRTVLMVVLNALINFFLRLPELCIPFSVSEDLFGMSWSFVNLIPSFPAFMADVAYFFYILTFTSTFIVYYLFNMKFKQSFSEYTHAKKRI
jgi:hypothetical protein